MVLENILNGSGPIYGTHNLISNGALVPQLNKLVRLQKCLVALFQVMVLRIGFLVEVLIIDMECQIQYLMEFYKLEQRIFLTSGSTSYGTHNSIASFSDFGFGSYTRIDMLAGEAYGTKNVFIGSSTGAKYGTYDSLATTSSGIQYGKYTELTGAGTGQQYATYNSINNSGNNVHFGTYDSLSGAGTAFHFGKYTVLSGAGTGKNTVHLIK